MLNMTFTMPTDEFLFDDIVMKHQLNSQSISFVEKYTSKPLDGQIISTLPKYGHPLSRLLNNMAYAFCCHSIR